MAQESIVQTTVQVQHSASENNSGSVINLRIVRGPLQQNENESILSQYNRLASSQIPMHEFLHWVQDSPQGPCWHAILTTDDGEIVGHQSLIPLRVNYHGRVLTAAKSEYTFLREEFRSAKIRGFEKAGRPTHMISSRRLLDHCHAEGWGPILISTSPAIYRWASAIACVPMNVPVRECLLVLRPWVAPRKTPNLQRWQRASLWAIGIAQQSVWSPSLLFSVDSNGVRSRLHHEPLFQSETACLSFFEDEESRRWRYLENQYEKISLDAEEREYVIVKKGSAERYLRVCQWRLRPGQPSLSLIARLVQAARKQKALGVRWAIYGDDSVAAAQAGRMRKLGFLCARRTRTLFIHQGVQELVDAKKWKLTDAMFSFDP